MVQLIPNQLVKLYDTETFNQRNKRLTLDYRNYCQIVREEQTTQFQLKLFPDSENLIVNGDFTNDITSWQSSNSTWQWASGRLQGTRVGPNVEIIFQQVTVQTGKTHKVSLAAQFAPSQALAQLTVRLRDAANTNIVSGIYRAEDLGTQPFNIELFWDSGSATSIFVTFILNGDQKDLVYIDDVELYELTEPAVRLENCNGTDIKTIPVFARSGNVITYSVDWFGLPEDCYRICISGLDDTEYNYLDEALALSTEGGLPIELEQGGYLKWFG